MSDQDKYPGENSDFISDERFAELTGGIQKDEIYPFLVDMRDYGSAGIKIDGEIVKLKPGNLENGSFFPQLDIEGDGVRTSLTGLNDTKIAISVQSLADDLKELGEVKGKLDIKKGTRIQDETDFALIPASHWRAVSMAIDHLPSAKKAAEAAADANGRRRGRFLSRIFRSGQSPYKD